MKPCKVCNQFVRPQDDTSDTDPTIHWECAIGWRSSRGGVSAPPPDYDAELSIGNSIRQPVSYQLDATRQAVEELKQVSAPKPKVTWYLGMKPTKEELRELYPNLYKEAV